jgi:hypothetical protein
MAAPTRPFSPTLGQVVDVATAQAMLASIRAYLDDYAREIFDLWFEGKAAGEVTFDNPRWANYMRANDTLARHVDAQLNAYAEIIRSEVEAANGRLSRPFSLTVHAELGSDSGGYRKGYNVLHGSNRNAGDFLITGNLTAVRAGPANGAYTVTYSNLNFVFNDIVDANKKYASDVTGLQLANNLARVLKIGPPRDYTLRIKWSALAPKICQVGPYSKTQGATFLKAFPNR